MDNLTTPTSAVLVGTMAVLAVVNHVTKKKKQNQIISGVEIISSKTEEVKPLLFSDGPRALPIIGNLHQLAKYQENPIKGFSEMAKQFGSIFHLYLGNTKAYVISEFDMMKEVLIKKGNHFDSRPNFQRWNWYFGGDRQKSLALCDWSEVQKTRRNIVRSFLLFRQSSPKFDHLDTVTSFEMSNLMKEIAENVNKPFMVKKNISYCAMNIIMNYMCSERFDTKDPEFQEITKCFDLIFEDINNGHPTDFLPWTSPLFKNYQNDIHNTAAKIREFILKKIIKDRAEHFDNLIINDLVDALLSNYFKQDGKLALDWQDILYALEDILGGSSAIGNTVLRALGYIALNPQVQQKLQAEIDEHIDSNRSPNLHDRQHLKYCEATLLEVLRHTCSPLVPHVANQDTSIGDYFVENGAVIFFNNHDLNNSEELWDEPEKFEPERFLCKGEVKKPVHFMPFSTGKRACVGSKMLTNTTFITIVNLLQKYNVKIPEGETPIIPVGKVSVIGDGYNLVFNERN